MSQKRRNPKHRKKAASAAQPTGPLQGWKTIADFLGLPVTTAQRWGKSGMPVRRQGRFTVADPDELRQWLGRESEMPAPAHIATNSADLAAGLKASIVQARRHKRAA
jgi:hypothetical protein